MEQQQKKKPRKQNSGELPDEEKAGTCLIHQAVAGIFGRKTPAQLMLTQSGLSLKNTLILLFNHSVCSKTTQPEYKAMHYARCLNGQELELIAKGTEMWH